HRPPQGCRFHTRCPHARERCREEEPPLAAADGHSVACHFWKEIEPFTSASRLTPVNERLTRLQAAFHTGGGSS
ncbi:MAG: oligopeptide ABC transporter ATP-binding protein, partial [Betaproteobacteria bacterium]